MNTKVTREKAVRDIKSNLILDAACKVFSEHGFHDTRLEDIAIAAGFSKASLYNYYTDKEQIFLSLANRDFEELLAAIRAEIKPENEFVETIERMIRKIFTFFGTNIAFFIAATNVRSSMSCVNLAKFSQHHEQMFTQFKAHFTEILEAFETVVDQARLSKEIQTTLLTNQIAGYIASLVRGTILEWKISGKEFDAEFEIKSIMEFIKNGVEYSSATPDNDVIKKNS